MKRCHPLPLVAALALLASAAAANEPSHAAAPAEPRPGASEPRRGLPNGPVDPMETLREKLAARLAPKPAAAASAPAKNEEVRVALRHAGESTVTLSPSALAHKPRAAAPKPAEHTKHAEHWSYEGDGGPQHWGALKPEFATCASGQRQSPIDMRESFRVEMDPIGFSYKPGTFRVLDNGHTVQVNVAPGNTIEVQGRRYDLVQFHFHRPSEETIDGRRYDMSLHLVHRDISGKLAVVGLLLEEGPMPHAVLRQVWANLPLERGDEVFARSPIDIASLLPADRGYFTTMGSLTTPPCTEGVLWMVMKQPVTVSAEQIRIFARLYPMNARPIQRSAGRVIKESP